MQLSLRIAGAAGQGLQTIGMLLSRIFFRSGYYVFVTQDYQSRIRGGHNSFQVRISDSPVLSPSDTQDLVIALDETSIGVHREELSQDGVMMADFSKITSNGPDKAFLDIPWNKIALKMGGNKIFVNTVAVGAVLGLLDFGTECLNNLLQESIGKKKPELLEKNIQAASAGYNFIRQNFPEKLPHRLSPLSPRGEIIANGNEAIALGALAAGCSFYSAYPMTPSTSIMNVLAHYQKQCDVVVEQAEDEIAAINMALGASFAGARAMTGTSGGGFALMVEGLSLAGITETPLVIALAQRPGPATGLPTRTEQGDLLFALHAGHGEFQRAIFTPGTAEEAFQLTFDAFNLAEKYQIPVIIMTDQFLADAYQNMPEPDLSSLKIDRIESPSPDGYLRYRITPDGVSPRLIPGTGKSVVITDSDEHTEEGHLTEDLNMRIRMVDKRERKFIGIAAETIPPILDGPADADLLLMGWGSTYGVIRETTQRIRSEGGGRVSHLHFPQIWPFPVDKTKEILSKAGKRIMIENNRTGQLAKIMQAETGLAVDGRISRYDGLPFTVSYIMQALPA